MDQLVNVPLASDKAHMLQRVMDCRPGLSGLHKVYGPNRPTPYNLSICGKYNIFTRCTNRKQFDIKMTAVADVKKGKHMCRSDTKYSLKYQKASLSWNMTK